MNPKKSLKMNPLNLNLAKHNGIFYIGHAKANFYFFTQPQLVRRRDRVPSWQGRTLGPRRSSCIPAQALAYCR